MTPTEIYMHPHTHKKPKVLFLLKLRHTSGGTGSTVLKSSGLRNSAMFCKDMLIEHGYKAKLVELVDNNSIDREVHQYKPDVVVIEALWVVPEKFNILRKLHPNVKWIIRVHSKITFLAGEGHAIEWINRCAQMKNVYVSMNSPQAHQNFVDYFRAKDPSGRLGTKLVYLPNFYPVKDTKLSSPTCGDVVNVGCFGAIRLLKNPVAQAFAAIRYAEEVGKKCRFHVNAGRLEHGEASLNNLRALFNNFHGKHELVEHDWLEREPFLALVRSMDIGLQLSLSESFNIVAADFVSEGVPIITSPEIDWMPPIFTASPTDIDDIVTTMHRTMFYVKYFRWLNLSKRLLRRYVAHAELTWLTQFHPNHKGIPTFATMVPEDIRLLPLEDTGNFC